MNDYRVPRCRILPEPNDEVAFQIDGKERLRWHHRPSSTRPCFYPLIGPGGSSLTRMGHPGAPNHDHHKSVWFAHNKVLGIDFWSENTDARIRQKQWLAYHESDEECLMGVELGWYDGHNPEELLTQTLLVSLAPYEKDELLFEVDATFTPTAQSLEFAQTNFGFFAVRVAANISRFFGGGELTNSEGARGEKNIFEKPARWMDYSGPVPTDNDKPSFEGITYFDHPSNSHHPNHWHVRQDGWMGCSPCMNQPIETTKQSPFSVRYLLHVHAGDIDPKRAEQVFEMLASRPQMKLLPKRPHKLYEIKRG